jgi:hypothetical protein
MHPIHLHSILGTAKNFVYLKIRWIYDHLDDKAIYFFGISKIEKDD